MRQSIARARLHYLAALGIPVGCGASEANGIPSGLVVAPALASGAVSNTGPSDGGAIEAGLSVAHRALPPEPRAPAGQSCQRNVSCKQEEEDMPMVPFPAPFERCLPSGGKSDSRFSVNETNQRRQWDPHTCCYVDFSCQKTRTMPLPGRPLRDARGEIVLAAAEARGDWLEGIDRAHPNPDRAAAFLATAVAEHASIAAFARVSLELMSLGAPSDLVREVHAAALDEIEHARACFALAARFGAPPSGPGALPLAPLAPVTIADVAKSAIMDGFANEAAAAHEARERAEREGDAVVRRVLLRIAEDEERHAALGLKIARWALAESPDAVRAVLASTVAELDASAEIVRDLVVPCLLALLD
jgi:hypothetical protein